MEEVFVELKKVVEELYGSALEPEVGLAPENIEADYSSNVALRLAKELHQAPMEIAGEIKERLVGKLGYDGENLNIDVGSQGKRERIAEGGNLDNGEGEMFEEGGNLDNGKVHEILEEANRRQGFNTVKGWGISVSAPGFVNFIAPDEYFQQKLAENSVNFDENISSDEYSGKTVICEFSDPNPFKVLHVGHLYTSIVGDAIARLFAYAGAKVVRANFGGDVGLHVAKTMYALSRRIGLGIDERDEGVKDSKGVQYNNRTINEFKAEENGRSVGKGKNGFEQALEELKVEDIANCYIEGTAVYEEDDEAKARIDELNKEIYAINAEDKHDTELARLYWRARELSYEYFEEFYGRIGVHFDKYYPESTVAGLGLEIVLRELKNGVYEKSDGAVVFDGEKYGLHTRVFVNKLGVPTYEAKDVGLIFTKYEDYHFDKSVVITGNEQLDYMKVVLKSVEQYAPELVERTTHLTHGLVKLPGNKKMSSRKGNFLKAVDVLGLVSEALAREYNSDDWRVALAAVKYAFIKYKMGGNIIFEPEESVKMTGNSGPYLLYSCVRAKKILAKNEGVERDFGDVEFEKEERELIKKILAYKSVLTEAVKEMAPHKVAGYLYELAQEFSRFYEKCPVTGSEKAGMRLEMVEVYLKTMTHGLGIMGIEIPEEM